MYRQKGDENRFRLCRKIEQRAACRWKEGMVGEEMNPTDEKKQSKKTDWISLGGVIRIVFGFCGRRSRFCAFAEIRPALRIHRPFQISAREPGSRQCKPGRKAPHPRSPAGWIAPSRKMAAALVGLPGDRYSTRSPHRWTPVRRARCRAARQSPSPEAQSRSCRLSLPFDTVGHRQRSASQSEQTAEMCCHILT